jgi:2-polyprenyl-3-methyl-5-hydroxy-6-metoxy-1,4-benzoquinol methylase
MIDKKIKHENKLISGSRYAADFDYFMHDLGLERFMEDLKDKNCLELGCYHGEMTKKLARICHSVTAVDVDETCISFSEDTCRENLNVKFINSDFINFKDYSQYEVIYFSHALEHVVNDAELITHINKSMSRNQVLITIVPNGRSLSRQIAVNMGLMESPLQVTDFERKIGHHRTYDMQSLSSLFINSGMEIISKGGIMPKIFSNNQYDKCIDARIIDLNFLKALNNLSKIYPELCASIFLITKKGMA